ncbi:murein transglycosylase domain-containing protein [Arcobacter sp. CECT 8985]|uniref:murein transglycosylase domain-containing protein n=1 Tax=Arcobacter sp. CECT 8985 TaxID=1935424 RepID=UPI00100A9D17|nr:murein transglycosylase domain-containing protein [Arcobacter sp. CECT 8985]RXJ86029.1 lytic murein transglycosylase [Arcobacter sp. CECT 8985]
MKRIILILFIILFLVGCSSNDIYNLTKAAVSQNPSLAFKSLAKSKTIAYATNPKSLKNDIKSLDKNFKKIIEGFIRAISGEWGKDNVELPKQKEYVKYMQNYKSRALIDFDKGLVTIETIDEKNTKKSLHNAIVATLLLPDDPQSADLFNASKIKLGKTPYLLGEIKDDQNKNIRYSWRANRFAKILTKKIKHKNIKKANKSLKVSYVEIPMIKDHASVRVAKFKNIVEKYSKKYNISKNLIYAIIKTESNFNQFAISNAGAIGLMQIVPSTAGKDAYKYLTNKTYTPSKSYLFNANNNIKIGTVYLKILNDRYLNGIYNKISKEYCVISAYNTGSGNVLKTFSSNMQRAKRIINNSSTSKVYNKLITNLPYKETRRYLQKVISNKKEFVAL